MSMFIIIIKATTIWLYQVRVILGLFIVCNCGQEEDFVKWASDCGFTSYEQFFSYIMMRTYYIRCDVHFVLDQHAYYPLANEGI